jgi:hypothetical protein
MKAPTATGTGISGITVLQEALTALITPIELWLPRLTEAVELGEGLQRARPRIGEVESWI